MDAASQQGLEAILFLADEPVDAQLLADALELSVDEVEAQLGELAAGYEREQRGMVVRQVDRGWRMYTAPGAAPVVERWVLAGRTGRLTQAALETLAVVAYKQPISRQEISDIRGVNADAAVRSLAARGLVEDAGRDDGPGQAVLYATTTRFLERLGIPSLDALPPLTDFLPESPAPDEPALDAIKDARRRLAAGGVERRHDGSGGPDPLPPPDRRRGRGDGDMEELTGRLEQVARSAMDQLRQAVAAGEDPGEEAGDDRRDDTGGEHPAGDHARE